MAGRLCACSNGPPLPCPSLSVRLGDSPVGPHGCGALGWAAGWEGSRVGHGTVATVPTRAVRRVSGTETPKLGARTEGSVAQWAEGSPARFGGGAEAWQGCWTCVWVLLEPGGDVSWSRLSHTCVCMHVLSLHIQAHSQLCPWQTDFTYHIQPCCHIWQGFILFQC